MRAALATALALCAAALPAAAGPRGELSEALTAGSGPYVGNSLSAGFSPGDVDLDLGYEFGSDQDLVLYHSLWGSVAVWPVEGLRFAFEGSFNPTTSSTTADRGFFSLGGEGAGMNVLFHPGRAGDVRPYLQIGGGVDRYQIDQSRRPDTPQDVVAANFTQATVGGTVGADAGDTLFRLGGSKFFYDADAGALQLPPGIGGGPLGLGAVQGILPTRAVDWNVRGSIRQRFGDRRDWDTALGVTHASYVDGDGEVSAVSLRLGHELTRSLRGHVGVAGQVENLNRSPGSGSKAGVFANAGISVLF